MKVDHLLYTLFFNYKFVDPNLVYIVIMLTVLNRATRIYLMEFVMENQS